MFLSSVGIFIAGTLSYAEISQKAVPCGTAGGCAAVTNSVFSKFMGIPVAFLGLGAYLVLLTLAAMRPGKTGTNWSRLTNIGFGLSGLGLGFSLWLQIVSITQLGELCPWCLASASTMLLLFVVHGLLAQTSPSEESSTSKPEFTWVAGCFILALGATAIRAGSMNEAAISGVKMELGNAKNERIMPDATRVMGNADAKVTLVEFADMNCPTCRLTFPEIHKLYEKYNGKLRIAFRHFPLFEIPGHETSIALSVVAQYAAEQGKFWEFMTAAMDTANMQRVKAESGIIAVAEEVGLKEADVKKVLDDETTRQKYLDQVSDDVTLAKDELKIEGTPAFILLVDGEEPQSTSYQSLEGVLNGAPYAPLLK